MVVLVIAAGGLGSLLRKKYQPPKASAASSTTRAPTPIRIFVSSLIHPPRSESPHATGCIRTTGVRGSTTLESDEPTQHRHRHSLANAGARRSPSTVHFGGRFFVLDNLSGKCRSTATVTHRIGIIGGDGIGPEVVAEALKVVDATGVAYEPLA